MKDLSNDKARFSLNAATLKKQISLREIVELCVANEVGGVAPWRDQLQQDGLSTSARFIRESGLRVSSLCRGGFFAADGNHNFEDNKRAIDEAREIGAEMLVIVSGGMLPGNKVLGDTHKHIAEGLAKMVDYCDGDGPLIALEPLHPMYAADRCAINTIAHALDICEEIGKGIGLVIDVYHCWWDPDLAKQIERAGQMQAIAGFHVCDWLIPTEDMLLDRGMPGDGIIDIKGIREMVEKAGYEGMIELEIFSNRWWSEKPAEVLRIGIERHQSVV